MFSPGYDEDVNAELFELQQRARRHFVTQYEGRELLFAMSLFSARWDAALKDIKWKRLPRLRWETIIRDAIERGVVTEEYAEMYFPIGEKECQTPSSGL